MPAHTSSPRVAVVTGGHAYDVPGFHALFRRLDGADVFIQHTDDFASSSESVRDGYDAVVFYTMLKDGPSDEGHPWYAGKPLTALERLGETAQGIFVFHHALLAYPAWPVWSEIVGIADRRLLGYHMGQSIRVRVARPDHPVTHGLSDWDMIDETYTMAEPGEGNEVLLTVDHPKSMRSLAWTRRYRNSRVLCFQSGHDAAAWENPNFGEVVRRGILWCAGRV